MSVMTCWCFSMLDSRVENGERIQEMDGFLREAVHTLRAHPRRFPCGRVCRHVAQRHVRIRSLCTWFCLFSEAEEDHIERILHHVVFYPYVVCAFLLPALCRVLFANNFAFEPKLDDAVSNYFSTRLLTRWAQYRVRVCASVLILYLIAQSSFRGVAGGLAHHLKQSVLLLEPPAQRARHQRFDSVSLTSFQLLAPSVWHSGIFIRSAWTADVGAMMRVQEFSPMKDGVSWTANEFKYFLHIIDRTKVIEKIILTVSVHPQASLPV